jgi:hypothetical protein
MGSDKRNFARIPVPMDIEVRRSGVEMMVLESADISNGGAFLKVEPRHCPPVGTELQLRVKGSLGGEEPPTMHARVVRTTHEGVGVEFLEA